MIVYSSRGHFASVLLCISSRNYIILQFSQLCFICICHATNAAYTGRYLWDRISSCMALCVYLCTLKCVHKIYGSQVFSHCHQWPWQFIIIINFLAYKKCTILFIAYLFMVLTVIYDEITLKETKLISFSSSKYNTLKRSSFAVRLFEIAHCHCLSVKRNRNSN